MRSTEFYKRVTILALYEHTKSLSRASFIYAKVTRQVFSDETIKEFVRDTVEKYYLVDCQLLERVGEEDWYIITADRTQHINKQFLSGLTPCRATQLFDAIEQYKARMEAGIR